MSEWKPRTWATSAAAAHISRRGPSVVAAFAMAACGGDLVELGTGDAAPTFGDPGQSVRNLNEERNEEYDPTFTDDLLDIFFISDRSDGVGNKDVWHAQRRDRRAPFDPPNLVADVSSPLEEASVAVSGDGLTLWVGSRREGGLGGIDIWRAVRPDRSSNWFQPEPVEALSSEFDDLPRPPGQGGSVLPIASDRPPSPDGGLFQTFFATRVGDDDFEIEPLEYLWDAEASMEDGFLSGDGLHLFFRRALPGQPGNLFVTWRTSTEERFRPPESLDTVNSGFDERDPFVSADRSRFFFASNQGNGTWLDIYATRLKLPTYR